MMMDEMVIFVSAPQSKCDHDIVGGVVEVFVLGDAEEDQQVEDQHQGGEGGVASHLHKVRSEFPVWQRKEYKKKQKWDGRPKFTSLNFYGKIGE